jgi:hypothetical protein
LQITRDLLARTGLAVAAVASAVVVDPGGGPGGFGMLPIDID